MRGIFTAIFVLISVSAWGQAGPGDGGVAGPNSGISGPGPGSGGGTGVTNPLGGGVNFTALNGAFFVPATSILTISGNFTISVWIQTTAFSGGNNGTRIAYSFLNRTNGWILTDNGHFLPDVTFGTYPGNNGLCANGFGCAMRAAVNDGVLHLLTGVFTGGTSTLYLDGVVASGIGGTASTLAACSCVTGFGAAHINMTLIDLRIYGRTLSSTEISSLFSLGQGGLVPAVSNTISTGLIGYWPLSASTLNLSGGGGTATDISGNSLTATIDSTSPVVAITAPAPSAVLTGIAPLTASATDVGGLGIDNVQFLVDGNPVGTPITVGPYTYNWDSTTIIDATHVISAIATGKNGFQMTAANVTVTTNNGVNPKIYYFAAGGNDANTCLVQGSPCQTIIRANALHYTDSDQIKFNGGDSFTGCLALTSTNVNNSQLFPVIITNYGTGTYTITCSGFSGLSGAILINGVSATVQNGTLRPGAASPRGGVYAFNTTAKTNVAILVQNMDIGGFTGAGGSGGVCDDFGGQVFIDGAESSAGFAAVQVLNNTLHGLTGTTSSDDNGISGVARSNVFNALYQGNTIFNIGGRPGCGLVGNGIISNGVRTGTTQFNLVHDNGANNNTCGGAAGQWTASGADNITLKFGEVYNMQPTALGLGCDWDGYDFDIDTTNSVGEYLYSHDNFGIGFANFVTAAWGPNQWRYNISENDAHLHGATGATYIQPTSAGNIFNVKIYNNTLWLNTPDTGNPNVRPAGITACCSQLNNLNASGFFANNIFAITENDNGQLLFANNNGNGIPFPNILFKANDWYNITGAGSATWNWSPTTAVHSLAAWQAVAPGGDTGAVTVTPLVTSGGMGGNCTWTPSTTTTWPPSGCPAAYVLQSMSTMLGAGIDVNATFMTPVGTRDYYANTIPYGSNQFNIGADGGNP